MIIISNPESADILRVQKELDNGVQDVYINGFCGYETGLALYDIIKSYNVKVHAVGSIQNGMILVYLAGNERHASPRCKMIYTRYQTDISGDILECKDLLNTEMKTYESIMAILSAHFDTSKWGKYALIDPNEIYQ